MSVARDLLRRVRTTLLARINRGRLRESLARIEGSGTTPVFFIFTPDIVHFAPYSLAGIPPRFEPVLVLNAVSPEDEAWLRSVCPGREIVRLRASLTGNPHSLLSHGDVLNDLFAVCREPFCIQDPDCFVTDPAFWEDLRLDRETDFAAGPFVKSTTHHDHPLPDTFFILFNPGVFREISRRYRISAQCVATLVPEAQAKIRTLGYHPGEFPEQFKNSFDTLQAFWVLAFAEGFRFNVIPGAGETVFHIGGTSYLHTGDDLDPSHWDFWPLSVQYFNLRLLELPECRRFRERFDRLIGRYGSSESLLAAYPGFRESRRFWEMQRLLDWIEGNCGGKCAPDPGVD